MSELRKKRHRVHHEEEHQGEGPWLMSYADMMTLLCGFFIMLFTMSKLDEPQYEKMKEAVSKEFKGSYTNPTDELEGSLVVYHASLEGQVQKLFDVSGIGAGKWTLR